MIRVIYIIWHLAITTYENDIIDDLADSNNGDHYAVFNTVLSTIRPFFDNNPLATMMVQGSDNKQKYIDKCKETCKKKCEKACKNTERRINIYRCYVDKNYEDLIKEYEFIGGEVLADGTILKEAYCKGTKYDAVFCKKRLLLLA